MHNRITSNLFRSIACGLFAVLLMAFTLVTTSAAQEKVVNKIEVKDGKVYVNGEMVKELEDADRPLIILGEDANEGHAMSFFSSGDDDSGSAFVFSKKDGLARSFEIDGDHNKMMGFFKTGGNVEVFGDHDSKMHKFEVASDNFSAERNFMWESFAPNNLYFSNRGETDEIRQLERKSHEMARSYKGATETEKSGLADDLRRILEKIFDLKETAMTDRLEKMSTELNKLTQRVEERHQSKEDIVTRRYQELIGEKDSLSW